MVKEFLSQRGVGYREIDISRDQSAARELVRMTGQTAVPVIMIGSTTIIGFDRSRLEQAVSSIKQNPVFGVAVTDASSVDILKKLNRDSGAYIGKVKPGSTADRTGLMAGDVIVEFNERKIATADAFIESASKIKRGERFSLVLIRGDKSLPFQGIFS